MADGAQRYFCSVASQANGESLAGTVARIRSWLLIEYPNLWRRDAVEDSTQFSPAVKQHLRSIGVDRTLLVRQTHRSTWPARALFADGTSMRLHQLGDFEQLLQLTPSTPGTPVNDLLFAVCTHSRHDKCCAKFGIPVWCALRDYTPGRAWQCSHVGGDRFAANLVVFPYGVYYGRVTPADVPELVRRSEAGEVWLPGYRGQSVWPRAVQVADNFLRRECGELRIDAFRPVRTEGFAVEFDGAYDAARYRVEFSVKPSLFRQRLTCASEEESAVNQYELVSVTRKAESP